MSIPKKTLDAAREREPGRYPLPLLERKLASLEEKVERRRGAAPPRKPRKRAAPAPATLGPSGATSLRPPVAAFTSTKRRRFTLGPGKREERFPGDTLWTETWPILYKGQDAGKIFRSLSYGTGATGEPRWHASTRALYWTYAREAPSGPGVGIGYDVAAFDTAKECLAAWGDSADQILDFAQRKKSAPQPRPAPLPRPAPKQRRRSAPAPVAALVHYCHSATGYAPLACRASFVGEEPARKKREKWTSERADVTCPKCRSSFAERDPVDPGLTIGPGNHSIRRRIR